MSLRFDRDYRLFISFTETEVVEIKPPLRIQFEARKTIISDINELKLKIYNLNEAKRNRLVLDKSLTKKYFQLILQVGYKGALTTIFKGNLRQAGSKRNGPDWITEITSDDGGFDMRNSFTAKTISPSVVMIDELLKDFKEIKKGKVTSPKKRVRPKVLVGNTYNLIKQNLFENEKFFIDDEKLNVLKEDELIDDFAVEVSTATGLMQSPLKEENFTIVETMMNPVIKVGSQIDLQSANENLNGLYKVQTIEYSGDNRGDDWKQILYCNKSKNFKVIK